MTEQPEAHFLSESWHYLTNRGWIVGVRCDKPRDRDAPGLTGKVVMIDDYVCTVRGVDKFGGLSPIAKGEGIGLLVDIWPEQAIDAQK
jgi:hypothetical protein